MTFNAGTILDLSKTCDKLLEYFYFRKSSSVDLDAAQIELPFAYEKFDIAIKKLEKDGFIKITRTKSGDSGRITHVGEIFYRTNSYDKQSKNKMSEKSKTKFKEIFEYSKGFIEIIISLITILLAVWTFVLDKKITSYESQINKLQRSFDSIKNKNSTLEHNRIQIRETKSN